MSDMKATVAETKNGFHVEGYEKIEYDFTFIDNIFTPEKPDLANCYERWGRCLAVMDQNIFDVYGDQIQKYFDHHKLDLKIHKTMIGEKAKTMPTLLSIVDSMTEFGIYRKVCDMHLFYLPCHLIVSSFSRRCKFTDTHHYRNPSWLLAEDWSRTLLGKSFSPPALPKITSRHSDPSYS